MPTIQLNSNLYDVYADVEDADLYLIAAIHAANWQSATEDTKKQALVSATRLLDRQRWRGDKTDSSEPLAWPRTSTGIDGVEDDIVPADIVNGSIELALSLIDGSDVQANSTPLAQKLESIKAGSVALTYFRSAEGIVASGARFPTVVQELVGRYLAGSEAALLGVVTGVESGTHDGNTSVSDDDFGFSQGV